MLYSRDTEKQDWVKNNKGLLLMTIFPQTLNDNRRPIHIARAAHRKAIKEVKILKEKLKSPGLTKKAKKKLEKHLQKAKKYQEDAETFKDQVLTADNSANINQIWRTSNEKILKKFVLVNHAMPKSLVTG